ncbi:FAD-dependent oxidoreductase [Sinorhizobium medicae]|uniref:FAD-dependent oxidoreductase n=1 Tax=Sinorhizobium medicae TaxID=110321 RepID=UPI0013E310BD|nr:FAD-dependent oxidoreductase [Sinorhizobium medicae]
MKSQNYDVIVLGGGSAGIAAAVAAARNGARTALVEAGPMLGGELLTGMTVDGAINGRGEDTVGGVLNDLLQLCRDMGGFVAKLNDWRLIQYVAYDPEIMKIAIPQLVFGAGVTVHLQTFAEETVQNGGRLSGLVVRNKGGRQLLTARAFVDASGDGDLCAMAGVEMLSVGRDEKPQPMSMMFRMANVDTAELLTYVREHPECVAVGESEAIRGGRTDREITEEIYRQGQPCVFFKGDGPLLGDAIARGEMFATALIMIQPTSDARREVCINATRITLDEPNRPDNMATALRVLTGQVFQCAEFLRKSVAGFGAASISGMSPRIGIRETRRVVGDYILTEEDVLDARKRDDGVAKGCHHVDIHQDGTGQIRIPVADGGSYDIPLASLLPKGLENVVIAGRCLSASREAQGSARVMGSCMAMGQAAGSLTAMAVTQSNHTSVRDIPVARLRQTLKDQGAILEGTR